MKNITALLTPSVDLIGRPVSHNGEHIGRIIEIRRGLYPTGRRYALIEPTDLSHDLRRLPVDELMLEAL